MKRCATRMLVLRQGVSLQWQGVITRNFQEHAFWTSLDFLRCLLNQMHILLTKPSASCRQSPAWCQLRSLAVFKYITQIFILLARAWSINAATLQTTVAASHAGMNLALLQCAACKLRPIIVFSDKSLDVARQILRFGITDKRNSPCKANLFGRQILCFDTNATHSWGVSCVTEALCCTLVPLFWDLLSVLHGLSLYCRSSQPWSKQWRQLAVADRYIRLWALQVVRLFFTTNTIVSLGRWDVVGSFARISLRTISEWNAHYLGCSPPLY